MKLRRASNGRVFAVAAPKLSPADRERDLTVAIHDAQRAREHARNPAIAGDRRYKNKPKPVDDHRARFEQLLDLACCPVQK